MTFRKRPLTAGIRTAVVTADLGFHEDPRHPGTGAHYWSVQTDDGTLLVLADPGRQPVEIGGTEEVICREGAPNARAAPTWIWARNRSRLHFNPPILPGRSDFFKMPDKPRGNQGSGSR